MRDATPSETQVSTASSRFAWVPPWARHVIAASLCVILLVMVTLVFDAFIMHAFIDEPSTQTISVWVLWLDEVLVASAAIGGYVLWVRHKSLGRKASLMDALINRGPEGVSPQASFDLICDSAIYINDEGFIQDVTPGSASFFGYRPEDMLGRKNHDVITHAEPEVMRRANWAALNEEKEPLSFEGLRAGADGTAYLMSVTVFPVLTAFGSIEGFWILYRAISDEEALENQRKLHDAVWEQLDEVIIINDLKGTVISANRAAEKYFGRMREELVGFSIRNLVKDCINFDPFHKRILKGLEETGQWREVFEAQWVSGKKTWTNFLVKPLTDARGQIIGHINTFTDVSDQQRAEFQRRLSERRYRMLFETSTDGIVIGRARGPGEQPEVLEANDTYLNMIGYTLEEHKNLPYQATTPEEWRAFERKHILPIAKADGVTPVFEKELISKSGDRVPVSCRYWRIDDPEQEERLVIGFYRDISDQKTASVSQERQLIALNQTQDVMIIQEVSGRILEVNRAAEQLFGKSQDALSKLYRAELLHPDFDREQFSHDWALGMQEDGAWSGDLAVITADGSKRIVDASSTALRDQLDRIIAVVDVYRDVTEARAREQRLDLYEQVWNQVQDGIAVFDLNLSVQEANRAALDFYALPEIPDSVSEDAAYFESPEDGRARMNEIMSAISAGEECLSEYEVVGKDGQRRSLEQRTVPYRDANGSIVGSIGLSRDVTERRRNEQRLRLYEQVWSQVRDGVSVVDLEGNLLEANPAAMETFGTAHTPTGQDAYQWVAKNTDAAALKEEVIASVRDTGEWLGEFDILTDGGEARRIEQRSVAFRNEDGEIIGRIGLTRDITEKRATDQRLRLFEAVWNQISEAVTLVDNDGAIIDLNPTAERMLEQSKDELVGSNAYRNVQEPVKGTSLQAKIKKSVAKTGKWTGEMLVSSDSGAERVLDHSVVPLRDETGEIIGRIGVSRDVTQDRETRGQLDRQAVALEQVSDPIFMTDVAGKVQYCNAAAERLLSKSRQEICDLEPFELYSTKSSYQKQLEERERQIRENGVFTGAYQFMRRDGMRWVEFSKTPMRDEAGEITGFISVHRDQTERLESEQVLKRQAAALDQVREAVFMSDLRGRIIYANDAALNLTGNTVEELKSMDPAELYEGEAGYLAHVERRAAAIEEKGVFEAEYEHEGPDGLMLIEYTSSPIRDPDGRTVGFISVNRDITLRRKAEQALMRQAIVMDQIGDAVTVFDLNGIIVDCNQKTPRLFDISRDQLIGQPSDFAAADKEVFAKQRVAWRAAVLGGSTWTGEVAMRASNGREFTLETTVAPLTNSDGELTHFTAVSRDVTERKLEEARRLRHETIWQQMGDAILLIGLDEQILDCNPSAAAITGFKSEDLLGMQLSELDPNPEKNTERRIQRFATAAAEGRWQGQGEILSKAGDTRIIDAVVVPLRGEVGQLVSNILVFRDITDRQATEAQLRQAQKMEAVGRLTGGIAHDFNNLLAVIIGNLELGIDFYDQVEDLRKASKKALTAAHKGAALTQQLLDYARTREHTPVVTELNAMIGSMLDLLKGSLGDPVELDLQLDDAPCYVSVDPNQLENAIINLAINARDAMPDGGRLTLRTTAPGASHKSAKKGKSKKGRIGLEIVDTGSGISDDVVSKIFDPFFTTKDVGKGSGLGLSMVFSFVQQSDGFISVESTPDEGTTFLLSFPQVDPDQTDALEDPTFGGSLEGAGMSVLLVEDDPTVRAVTASQLERMGFAVTEAVDVGDALAAVKDMDHCDVLVTDIGLPGGRTGIDLAKHLLAQNSELPILLMTGFAEDQVLDALPEDAHFNVIQKPFQQTTLAKTLKLTLALD